MVLVTSTKDKKKKKKGKENSYNTDILFSRVLLLLGTNQIEFEDVFDFELAFVPTSLFEESRVAKYPKNKPVLLYKLKVEESSRCMKPDATVIMEVACCIKFTGLPMPLLKIWWMESTIMLGC